jgi:Na+/H+ antiporter NhaB
MKAFFDRTLNSFLGHSPLWYKWTILLFLAINPVLIQLPVIVFAATVSPSSTMRSATWARR